MMNRWEQNPDPLAIASTFGKLWSSWMAKPYSFNWKLQELVKLLHGLNPAGASGLLTAGGDDVQTYIQDADKILEYLKHRARQARKHHLILADWLKNLVENTPDLNGKDKQRALFWTRQMLHALSPANYFWTNPTAVQRFMDTEGQSLRDGLKNWLGNVQKGGHLVKMADERAFRIGDNIASTPGRVIYRNALMELIQYNPVTETTYELPILCIPPWINKYYIFDLSGQNSFVRYLIHQGFTVFMISWKNPTADMRTVTFEDYLFQGVLEAMTVAQSVAKSPALHAAGYCIGGTTLAALMAWLNRTEGRRKRFP